LTAREAEAMRSSRHTRRLILAALVLGLTGCGNKLHPVRGTVALDDGTPVTRGLIVFERVDGGPAVTARGDIRSDGTYEMSTYKTGDGVPPGKYKVLVNPLDLSDIPDEKKNLPFDVKYVSFTKSGLEYEVKSGSNEYPITLARPAKAKR
jgi:hypothetical protein